MPNWKTIVILILAVTLSMTRLSAPISSVDAFKSDQITEINESLNTETVKMIPEEELKEELNIPLESEFKEEQICEEEIPSLDRMKPLYEVYKDGWKVEVPAELQWYIRDMCEEYDFYEKYVYGMILMESTFNPTEVTGNCYGLCQINPFWIKGANIAHFTENYRDRNLKDPYDNLVTLIEMWCYARDRYGLDLMTEDGMMRVCYWHNTGKDPRRITSSSYFNYCSKYADELISLQEGCL